MKAGRLRVAGGVLAALALMACGEDAGTIGPPAPSGPATLSGDVQPILTVNCAFSGCHAGTIVEPEEEPMNLAAGQVIANTVAVPSHQVPSMARIEPGDPDASYLVHKVQGTHLDPAVGGEGDRMPVSALPPLTSAEIAAIREWIAEGAQDN